MNKVYFCVIVIVNILVLSVVIFIGIPVIKHNGIADFEMEKLMACKEKSAKKITEYSKIGLFTGNSNHCDIFCLIMWKGDQMEESTMQHYASEYYKTKMIFSTQKKEIKHLIEEFSLYDIKDILLKGDYSYLTYSHVVTSSNGDIRCF